MKFNRIPQEVKEKRKEELFKLNLPLIELEKDDPLAIEAVKLSTELNNINLILKVFFSDFHRNNSK